MTILTEFLRSCALKVVPLRNTFPVCNSENKALSFILLVGTVLVRLRSLAEEKRRPEAEGMDSQLVYTLILHLTFNICGIRCLSLKGKPL